MLYGRSESIKRNTTVIAVQSKPQCSLVKFGICYPTEAPVFYLFAIQFGDRCPRTHITGLGTGLAQKGGWQERGLVSAGSEMGKHSAPLTGYTKLFNYLKFTTESSNEQI